jgi:hypothetical protein
MYVLSIYKYTNSDMRMFGITRSLLKELDQAHLDTGKQLQLTERKTPTQETLEQVACLYRGVLGLVLLIASEFWGSFSCDLMSIYQPKNTNTRDFRTD